MKKVLKFIIRIEASAYPSEYQQLQSTRNMADLVDYCEADDQKDVVILTGTNWYLLLVKSTCEIVDLASVGSMGVADLIKVWKGIRTNLPGRAKLDAREGTSYRLIKSLARSGRVTISHDSPYIWGDETFHKLELSW